MSRHALVALALSVTGILGLVFVFITHGSVRDAIKERYRFVGTEAVQGDKDRTLVYASSKPVSATAREISDAHHPADRRTTEAGAFLRYRHDIVSVLPDQGSRGRSRVLVDDEDTGYRRNYLFLGGFWGSYSGRGESFRGGGPGGGK
ncbi:MAG TPA: DUF4247 domain-containing protein [Solirubrobacteraceae bacterium]|nr:DUF4247 domain-containing protein [Solirubrobacteraceae bacterium]